MAKHKAKAGRPVAPEDLDGEQLIEWVRVCDELASIGRLATTDRAILVLYVNTWATYTRAAKHVATFGPIVPLANQVIAQSPFYKTMIETGNMLRRLLQDLGLSPANRTGVEDEAPDLSEF